MELKEVEPTYDLARNIRTMQQHGLLLTSVDAVGKPNVMAIGWGSVGVVWGRPVFTVLVRPSRFTWRNMEAAGEFVVSVPTDDMHDVCMHCGTVSGRDHDKFAECSLTTTPADTVRVPLIEQCAMHYECRTLLKNDVIESQLDATVRADAYGGGDFHRIYYGHILCAAARS